MACPRILGLASIISTSIATFHELLIANNQPLPSFEADNHWSLSEELEEARNAVIDAATELRDLLLEPADLLRMYARVCVTICKGSEAILILTSIAKSMPTLPACMPYNDSRSQLALSLETECRSPTWLRDAVNLKLTFVECCVMQSQ